jgi:hypothetical protein
MMTDERVHENGKNPQNQMMNHLLYVSVGGGEGCVRVCFSVEINLGLVRCVLDGMWESFFSI